MATLPAVAGHNTLLDIAKTLAPDGKEYVVAELLNQSNEVIQYMNFIQGNLPTGHKAAVRAGLPTVILRRFYKGVPPSKSGRDTIEDVVAMLEGRNEIDTDLASLNDNTNAFRMSEGLAFIEAMNQMFAQQIMYGNTATNKDGILGFTPRYNAISGATNGANILSAGASGSDNTSVWLVVWGENTVTGIYPKGSKAGLTQQDLGEIDAFDASNNRYRAYGERWTWKFGLHVKDWRYAVRIANIDVSDLIAQTGTQLNTATSTWLPNLMIRSFSRIPSMGMGVPTFLANRTVKEMLSVAAMNKTILGLTIEQSANQFGALAPGSVAGNGTGIKGGVLKFFGVPVLTVDQILLTETVVS